MKNKLSIILFFILWTTTTWSSDDNTELLFSPKGIAEVHITLSNDLTLNQVTRAEDVVAHMEIKNSENSFYDESQLYKGEILLKGRGNSTWGGEVRPWQTGRQPDIPIIEPFKHKRSYSVDLINEAGDEIERPLLDMPGHDKWALVTFFSDKSLMRIPLAYYLGRMMNRFSYAPIIRYVELYVNGEYRGLYGLCEKIERGRNRVDINRLGADDSHQIEPNISGGYIIEGTPLDRIDPAVRNKSFATNTRDIRFTFTYPKIHNVTNAQINWIRNYLNSLEYVLHNSNFHHPTDGWRKYLDENSVIDWFIIQELAKNIDAKDFYGSAYMYKARNGKLFMGPIWDFDIGFGNIDYQECYNEDGFRLKSAKWFNRFFLDGSFTQKVRDRYDELLPLFDQIPAIIQANQQFLEESSCVERNFEKFPILDMYIWPNYKPLPGSFRGEVQRLIEWTESRKMWLYINLGINQDDQIERFKNSRPTIRIMQPELFREQKSSELRVLRFSDTYNSYFYVWTHNGEETRKVGEKYTLDKVGPHFVQLSDTRGNRSLPSLPVAWGEEPVYYPEEDNTTSIQKVDVNPILFVSNPVSDYLTINYISSKRSELDIKLFHINGTVAKQFKSKIKQGINYLEFNTSKLNKGIYLLQIVDDSNVINRKIIKL
jgi:hypothetical protein